MWKAHTKDVNCVRVDRTLGRFLSGGDDCTVAVARLPLFSPLATLRCEVGVLSVASDHSRLVAGCEDNRLRLWDFQQAAEDCTFQDTQAWRALTGMAEASRSQLAHQQALGR